MDSANENQWVFLFPELSEPDGGYLAQQRFANITQEIIGDIQLANYRQTLCGIKIEDGLLTQPAEDDKRTYCIHYGPHITQLCKNLKGRRVIYFSHSTGWEINLPTSIPIVCVSKHCMAYWAKHSPGNPLFHLPNIIDEKFNLPNSPSEINSVQDNNKTIRTNDVLVIKRKMSNYVIDELVPQLSQQLTVKVIDKWTDAVAEEMQSAKVFIYDSSHYWKEHKASEGFGLPPLEAMACGCTVFSSINDGLADFLDPGFNCYSLSQDNKWLDISRIEQAVKQWQEPKSEESVVATYRQSNVKQRLECVIKEINSLPLVI